MIIGFNLLKDLTDAIDVDRKAKIAAADAFMTAARYCSRPLLVDHLKNTPPIQFQILWPDIVVIKNESPARMLHNFPADERDPGPKRKQHKDAASEF